MKTIFTESELMTLHELIDRKIKTEYEKITDNNIDKYVEMVALKAKINALYKMMNPPTPTPKTMDGNSMDNGTITLPYKPTDTTYGQNVPAPKIIGSVSEQMNKEAKLSSQINKDAEPKSMPFDENKISETVKVRT